MADSITCTEISTRGTPRTLCPTCTIAPLFEGWDECVACGTASLLIEDPRYLDFARKHFAGTQWLAELEREWARQLQALVACGAQRSVA